VYFSLTILLALAKKHSISTIIVTLATHTLRAKYLSHIFAQVYKDWHIIVTLSLSLSLLERCYTIVLCFCLFSVPLIS